MNYLIVFTRKDFAQDFIIIHSESKENAQSTVAGLEKVLYVDSVWQVAT